MKVFKFNETGDLYEILHEDYKMKDPDKVKLESGEHRPWLDCIVYRRLGFPGSQVYVREKEEFYSRFSEVAVTEEDKKESDPVNSPNHYSGKIETIDYFEQQFGNKAVFYFSLLNLNKYAARCMKKHETPKEDLRKAEWYLNKCLETLEKDQECWK